MTDDPPIYLPMPLAAASVFLKLAVLGRGEQSLSDDEWDLIRPICVNWARHAPHPGPIRRPDADGDWGPIPADLVRTLHTADLPEKCQACDRWVVVRGQTEEPE